LSKCVLKAFGTCICDVHTEGEGGSGSGGRMQTGRRHVDVRTENSAGVILSTSHAKKLGFFTRISSLGGIKSGNFSLI